MGQFRADPDLLDARATEYRGQGNEIEGVITRLDELIKVLENEFEGNSAKKFISQYEELRPNFNKMREIIEDLATALNRKAEEIRNVDR